MTSVTTSTPVLYGILDTPQTHFYSWILHILQPYFLQLLVLIGAIPTVYRCTYINLQINIYINIYSSNIYFGEVCKICSGFDSIYKLI